MLVQAVGAEEMFTRSCQDIDVRRKLIEVFKTYRTLICLLDIVAMPPKLVKLPYIPDLPPVTLIQKAILLLSAFFFALAFWLLLSLHLMKPEEPLR